MAKEEGIKVDTLFVGCTRPATLIGVPLSALMVEVVLVMETFIFTKNVLYLLSFFPMHLVFYLICLREPRIFELMLLWVFTKGTAFFNNFWFWKHSTYSPLTIEVGKSLSRLKRKF